MPTGEAERHQGRTEQTATIERQEGSQMSPVTLKSFCDTLYLATPDALRVFWGQM